MSDYIKREDAIAFFNPQRETDRINKTLDYEYAMALIKAIPSADVVEVKHGKWQITDAYPHNVYCSECHKRFAQTHWAVWEDGSLPRNYCPNCGADMRGE